MSRKVLDAVHIHPAIHTHIVNYQADIIAEVQSAIAQNRVVLVGMRQNPFPRKARKLLDSRGIAYAYLEYGSYFSEWRRRLALKMWTGWETFPMIFVNGVLIGGAKDLERLMANGELAGMLGMQLPG